ncbi:tRNA1(Val) (adenine(37)-N6)-methyltransferase [Wenxinia marina]|uniref:Putative O-methyltransferase n=1 Tax=Wenxinia marina DSM 24838 TaxID=1123501 RepID=A0A0D0QEV3_9RHOB|nr:methyltransferase [Wenxinia marina]KIQ70862.1 putative O-methyltransferase [Wenxinia marina DSM 24838]GGL56718.1 methyltransferase [Wenxinia marina]
MTSTSDAETTCDAFLGGRVTALQPRAGYRAGVDAVFLASAVRAVPGDTVLELGCGVGVAALCLMARVPGLEVTGVELHPAMAALARVNAEGRPFEVVEADVSALPGGVTSRRFAQVMMNPPYYDRRASRASGHAGREAAHGGGPPLAEWIAVASRRLAPGGRLTLIQRIDRLPEAMVALDGRLGSVEVAPLAGRAGRQPGRFLLTARKGGRGAFVLHPPFVLHDGPRHRDDSEDYGAAARAILREGATFPWAPGPATRRKA